MVTNPEAALEAAADIGYPVVVKADAESIAHKSDVGGVAINLKDGAMLRAAVEGMNEELGIDGLRFLIQRYLPGGREVILGAKAEEGLGHLIMFGIGGIFVEILKDVVFKLTPVTTAEAQEMFTSIQGAAILKGVRGEQGVHEHGLQEIILRLSQLVTDTPAIQEMDLNPILAFEDRVCVVDARISLGSSSQGASHD
jgi:acetyltransferase